MKKILLIFLLIPLFTSAQLSDNFSDGNFNQNPVWLGDTNVFKISTYSNSAWSQQPRLQLNGTAADTSIVYVQNPDNSINNKEWDFWVRLAFNTSKTNNCRVYLASDSPDFRNALNGFFVQFGDDNDDQLDSISIWQQTGTNFQKVFAGHTTFTGSSANYRIKIKRDASGNWTVLVDPTGGISYLTEGTFFNNTNVDCNYFGLYCKYTSSNKTNFYFDDIYVGPIIVDTVPPLVASVAPTSSVKIEVQFSETVDLASAEDVTNYFVPGAGAPISAVRSSANPALVTLTVPTLTEDVYYHLDVHGVKDIAGNIINDTSVFFAYYHAKPFDIVLNEIMADPDPVVGLPEAEYLEIYNRTGFPISLKNWKLAIGTSQQTFPALIMDSGSYVILTSSTNAALLESYGTVIGFSSFSLTNTGNSIALYDNNNTLIHYVNYSDSWYRDNIKKNGGWSLEQIDPANPCGESFNWKAAIDPAGGTPGHINSVKNSNPDLQKPVITDINIISDLQIEILFNESLRFKNAVNASSFSINNGVGQAVSATLVEPDDKKIVIDLANPIVHNVAYDLYFTDTIYDCSGNFAFQISKTFAWYTPQSYDILINEIMADPDPQIGLPNAEYLELFNTTDFPISLTGWKLQLGSSTKEINGSTIEPHQYLIICSADNQTAFAAYGSTVAVDNISISNTGEVISLIDPNNRLISFVNFSDDWYGSSVKLEGGWSLERKDINNPCGENNWSASNDQKGGTPGAVNSVAASNPDTDNPVLVRASVNRNEPDKIKIFFDQTLDSLWLKNMNIYTIDHGIGNPIFAKLSYPDNHEITLLLSSLLQQGIIYTLSISDSVFDCSGNKMAANSSARFAIPSYTDSADIAINEVLFNPIDNGVDYVELYNRSGKVLDISDLFLSNHDDIKRACYDNFLFFPEAYLVLTTNQNMVKSQYATPNKFMFVDMESMPTFSNEEGSVVLLTFPEKVVDEMNYTNDMHFPLLANEEGVSLERLDYNRAAADITNWHSASETCGFGTPAYKNSQFFQEAVDDGTISLSSDIFSPDNDGNADVLNIYCKTDAPGRLITIAIYDSKGRLSKNLVSNYYGSEQNTFSWDGVTNENQKASVGIYIIYAEVTDISGKVKRYKKTVVLACKL